MNNCIKGSYFKKPNSESLILPNEDLGARRCGESLLVQRGRDIPTQLTSHKRKTFSSFPECLKYLPTQRPFFLFTYVGVLWLTLVSSWIKGVCNPEPHNKYLFTVNKNSGTKGWVTIRNRFL